MKNKPDDIYFPEGKLPLHTLARMLKAYTFSNGRVAVGPSVGEDAAVIDMGDRYLLIKIDPITFVAEDIGTYTVRINANDIATMGGKPRWLLATILLPEKHTTIDLVERVFRQLSYACREIDVALCGGHTEITAGIDRVIVVGSMIGEAEKGSLITTGGARPGDDIILTKAVAIEGTSIIARQKENDLRAVFGERFVQTCKELLEKPGVSILKEAEIAQQTSIVHSMHDPTEGGVATGLYEIAYAADVGLYIEEESISVLPECATLCRHFGIDPLGLIASGSLLITLDPGNTGKILEALKNKGIPAARIGKIVPKKDGVKISRGGEVSELRFFERDEITKIYR